MSGMLHKLWHLPLRSPRRLVIAFTAAAVVLIAAALLLTSNEPAPQRTGPAPSQPNAQPASPAPRPEPTAPRLQDAKLVARGFLSAYLRASYGSAPANTMAPYATRSLVERLERQPPRRTPATPTGTRPRLVALTTGESASTRDVTLSALIADSRRSYTLLLTLKPVGGRWQVAALEPA